ncbi:hypothetical protein BGZ98_000320 [Dissophora globulifera]|nr:hypothetical protein BGZ98_000320 [Dissophora globulifera]
MASLPIPRRYRAVIYLPSRHDGCMLEVCLSIPTHVSSQPQTNTGVVIAHPYGPLGGSYNNNVVGAMLQWFETYPLQATADDIASTSSTSSITQQQSSSASTAEDAVESTAAATDAPEKSRDHSKNRPTPLACVICAFNFRGCGKSKGKTSWTGEAEREDYQTVVDFLQSGSHAGSSHLENMDGLRDSGTSTPAPVWSGKVFDEMGQEIAVPRLPFMSRFILSGYSYGGMIASTIPPPLRNPTNPNSGHLPTSYILISYPAGVAWFLTAGTQGSLYKRARAILLGEETSSPSTRTTTTVDQNSVGALRTGRRRDVEAYFIAGSQDQFTSSGTLMSWLKTNAGLNPSKSSSGLTKSWALKRPDGAIHLDVVDKVDHFWLDREQELLDRLRSWWTEAHPTSAI